MRLNKIILIVNVEMGNLNILLNCLRQIYFENTLKEKNETFFLSIKKVNGKVKKNGKSRFK